MIDNKFRRKYVFIGFFLVLTSASCGGNQESIEPQRKDIVESVYASATIIARNQYSVMAPVSGVLLSNTVREGDTVVPGQVIARIENINPALNAANAQLAVDLAQKNKSVLLEIQAQLNTAIQQFKLDSVNYVRQRELWSKNIGTKTQVEARMLAFEASKNNVAAIKVRYRQTKNQLETSLAQAQNNFVITAKTSGDFNISSNIHGRVYALNYKPGELVNFQKPVAILGDARLFLLELTVDEVDIGRVSLGQRVVVSMDAYKNEIFEANVTKIYPNLDARSQSFIVEAEFIKSPARLYPGMSAEASIVIREKKNALVIPVNYLTQSGKVLTENGEIAVKTGMKSIEMVEIISGIDEKTKLIRP